MKTHSTSIVAAAMLSGLFACEGAISTHRRPPQPAAGPDGTLEGPDGTEPPQPQQPEPLVPPRPRRARLLSGAEFRNTVRDLLGVEAAASLAHGDFGAGFDNGANATLDENTLSKLLAEAERAAGLYVKSRLRSDFPCFDSGCADQVVTKLARRAFRRELDAASRDALLKLFADTARVDPPVGAACTAAQRPPDWGAKNGVCLRSCGQVGGTHCSGTRSCPAGYGSPGESYDCAACCAVGAPPLPEVTARERAMELVVARLLLSAPLLYRKEVGLDAFERASLVSYTVTGSMPDDALLDDASSGALDRDRLRAHVRRLLDTPAGKARLAVFFTRWLRAESLDDMAATPAAFPKLETAAAGAALRDELHAYVQSVRTLDELLKGQHGFVNRHTAGLYGLTSASDALTRVALDPARRRGVLTLASVTAAHGSPGDAAVDRPVKRGLLVLNRLLCGEIGLPSGLDVAAAGAQVAAQVPNFDALTPREKLEAVTKKSAECGACHAQFMPLGFTFSNYDGLGRWVDSYGERSLDASVSGLKVDGETKSFANALELVDHLAPRQTVAKCFARAFAAYVDGERLEPVARGTDFAKLFEDTLTAPQLIERQP